MTIPPPCALPSHILRLAGLLPLRFLPQDTINVLSDLLGFGQLLLSLVLEINVRLLNVLFQNGKPPVNRFSLCAKYPSTFKNQMLNHTFWDFYQSSKQCLCSHKYSKQTSGVTAGSLFLLVGGTAPKPLFAEFHSAAAHRSGAFLPRPRRRFFENGEAGLPA